MEKVYSRCDMQYHMLIYKPNILHNYCNTTYSGARRFVACSKTKLGVTTGHVVHCVCTCNMHLDYFCHP